MAAAELRDDGAAALLAELVEQDAASAVVGVVGDHERILWQGSAGEARPGQPAEPGTLFDYGSLTKPFVATLALTLAAHDKVSLEAPLARLWPGSPLAPALGRVRPRALLRHRAGFVAWTPLYARCRTLADVDMELLGGSLLGPQAGELYSDLDYLVWGRVVARVTGRSLDDLLREHVLRPLGLTSVVVAPGDDLKVATTRCANEREIELAAGQHIDLPPAGPPPPGETVDGNARFLLARGWGLPASAGLFGTAADLWRLGAEWLRPGKLLNPTAVSAALAGGSRFVCGWWRRRRKGGGGDALSPGAFGHTGFPGGNLWIDRERERVFVLLAHRTSSRNDMNFWRRRFHAAALQAGQLAIQEGSR
jgi:CubicO group peptidase (beta-lactamase class C family)